MELVNDGDAAQVEQVLAGAQAAGAAALPVPDVGDGALDPTIPASAAAGRAADLAAVASRTLLAWGN